MVPVGPPPFQLYLSPSRSMPLLSRRHTGKLWLTIAALVLHAHSAAAVEDIDVDDEQECPTYADTDADAASLGLKGVTCFQAGQYDWALTHYLAAHQLQPDPMLLGGIGRSLHELGLYQPALNYYEKFLEQESDTSRAERIRGRVEALEESLEDSAATVSLRGTPPGTTAYVVMDNGEWYALGSTPQEIDVRPGRYNFAFDSDEMRPRTVSARASASRTTVVDTELVSEKSAVKTSRRARRRAGIWTSTSSLVVGAAGATLLVMSARETSRAESLESDEFEGLSDFDERQRDHLDLADATGRWGLITAAVGATGLLIGSTLYLTGLPATDSGSELDDDQADTASGLHVEPTVGLDQVGVRLRF